MNRPSVLFAAIIAAFFLVCPSEGDPQDRPDIAHDSMERRNVIKSHPEMAGQMLQTLDTLRQ